MSSTGEKGLYYATIMEKMIRGQKREIAKEDLRFAFVAGFCWGENPDEFDAVFRANEDAVIAAEKK